MIRVPDPSVLRKIRLLVFDFDGVFTDNTVYVFEDGREAVNCSRADGMGISRLKKLGFDMMVLSTETNHVVGARAKKLQLPYIQGVDDKLRELKRVAAGKNIGLGEIAYVGNDINDIECLEAVGLPIVVADAVDEVKGPNVCVTAASGGRGAVREVCDWFYQTLRGEGR